MRLQTTQHRLPRYPSMGEPPARLDILNAPRTRSQTIRAESTAIPARRNAKPRRAILNMASLSPADADRAGELISTATACVINLALQAADNSEAAREQLGALVGAIPLFPFTGQAKTDMLKEVVLEARRNLRDLATILERIDHATTEEPGRDAHAGDTGTTPTGGPAMDEPEPTGPLPLAP
jgi:hypothetical protein